MYEIKCLKDIINKSETDYACGCQPRGRDLSKGLQDKSKVLHAA